MKMPYIKLLLIFTLLSCENPSQKTKVRETKKIAQEQADSILTDLGHRTMFDTIGVSNGPVQVLSAKLVNEEYSNYKDVRLTFKNVSNKKIDGIRFRWYATNTFGEPADMGIPIFIGAEGFGSGFTDEPINSDSKMTVTWDVNSRDAKKIIFAWAYEVAFSDGTKWKTIDKEN